MYFNPMPRKRRFINPGEIHHVMSRGLDGMPLFLDDEDREKFITTVGNVTHRDGVAFIALTPKQLDRYLNT
jgi:hypothetical protein